eukprot:4755291-Ditylum_brightwellii.AAC.1
MADCCVVMEKHVMQVLCNVEEYCACNASVTQCRAIWSMQRKYYAMQRKGIGGGREGEPFLVQWCLGCACF